MKWFLLLLLCSCYTRKDDRDTEDMEHRMLNERVESLERSYRLELARQNTFFI